MRGIRHGTTTTPIEASSSATVSDGPGPEEKLFFPGEAACEDLVPEEAEA